MTCFLLYAYALGWVMAGIIAENDGQLKMTTLIVCMITAWAIMPAAALFCLYLFFDFIVWERP